MATPEMTIERRIPIDTTPVEEKPRSWKERMKGAFAGFRSRVLSVAERLQEGEEEVTEPENQVLVEHSWQDLEKLRQQAGEIKTHTVEKITQAQQSLAQVPVQIKQRMDAALLQRAKSQPDNLTTLHTIHTMLQKYEQAAQKLEMRSDSSWGDPFFAEDMRNRLKTSIDELKKRREAILLELEEEHA